MDEGPTRQLEVEVERKEPKSLGALMCGKREGSQVREYVTLFEQMNSELQIFIQCGPKNTITSNLSLKTNKEKWRKIELLCDTYRR